MDLKPLNPWQELERAEREFEQLSSQIVARLSLSIPGKDVAFVPPIDLVETGGDYRIYVVLPGMVEEDIDVLLSGAELVIRGEREGLFTHASGAALHRHLRAGYFERRVALPEAVDPGSLRATYEAGILTITVPKSP